MISLADQDVIRKRFATHLIHTVRIDHFTQPNVEIIAPGREPCPTCDDAVAVMRELAALSGNIRLEEHLLAEGGATEKFGIEQAPATVVRGPNNRALKFYGLPGGRTFPIFVETLVAAAHGGFDEQRNGVSLDLTTKQRLKRLKDDVRMTVFVEPRCGYSPQMALLAFALGLESHRIKVEVVEIGEYPRLAARLRLAATPTTILNNDVVVTGAVNEADMLARIMRAAQGHGKAGGGVRTEYQTPLPKPHTPESHRGPGGERRTAGGLILPG